MRRACRAVVPLLGARSALTPRTRTTMRASFARSFAVGAVMALLHVVGADRVSADTPEGGGTPGTFITVTPSDNLVGDATVQVSGTGFFAREQVFLQQCGGAPTRLCGSIIPAGVTDDAGNFGPVSFPVFQTLTPQVPLVDCSTMPCEVVAFHMTAPTRNAFHHVSFAAAPYPLSLATPQPATDVLPPASLRESDRVTGLPRLAEVAAFAVIVNGVAIAVGLRRKQRASGT